MPLARGDLGKKRERVEALRRYRDHAINRLQRSAHDNRSVAIEDSLIPPVRRGTNDDVRDPGLVLERKEDVALRRLGVLLHHDGAGDEHVAPVTAAFEVACAQYAAPCEVFACFAR